MSDFSQRRHAFFAASLSFTLALSASGPAAQAASDDIAEGERTFHVHCVHCHGPDGVGAMGPNLTDEATLHGDEFEDILNTVPNGVEGKPMRSWKNTLSAERLAQVAKFVYSLKGTRIDGRLKAQ